VLLFPGRPDPIRSVAEQAKRLLAARPAAGPWTGPLLEAPPLGYCGSFLLNEGGRGGRSRGRRDVRERGPFLIRRDNGRSFERALFETAPRGSRPGAAARDFA
jgi:hypothetical protein